MVPKELRWCHWCLLKPWPNYRTKLDSTLQLCSIPHCSTVLPPMLGDARPTFFVRSSAAWSLLLIKHCDQQFCSTQQCCSVLPLFQQSCVLNRVTFALLANHESLSYFQAWASSIICNEDGGQGCSSGLRGSWWTQQAETLISKYEARPCLWDTFSPLNHYHSVWTCLVQ